MKSWLVDKHSTFSKQNIENIILQRALNIFFLQKENIIFGSAHHSSQTVKLLSKDVIQKYESLRIALQSLSNMVHQAVVVVV